MSKTFSISNETNARLPRLAFRAMKEEVLGLEYNLNLVLTTAARMKKLNTIYRNKEVATDILSFPLNEREGEIYMCLPEARKEAKKFDRTFENFLGFLFIHGCVHLKGHDHGATMEHIEAQIRDKFHI